MSDSRSLRYHDPGVGTLRRRLADRSQRTQPLAALLLLDWLVVALRALAELGRIARPALHVEDAERQALWGEGERAVQQQALRAVQLVGDGADALHPRAGGISEAAGVLRHQHQRFAAHAFGGGLAVRFEQAVHADPVVVEEAIGCLGGGRRATGLRDVGLRLGKERRPQVEQPGLQPRIAEFGTVELAMHPARAGWRTVGAPPLQGARRQRIEEHPLAGQAALGCAVLPAAAGGHADLDPVGRAVGGAGTGGLDTGLHQPGGDAVALLPVGSDAPDQLAEHVRGEMLHLDGGQNEEAAVADDGLQVGGAFGVGPAQPGVARGEPPGGGADRQAAEHTVAVAADQVAELRATQLGRAEQVVLGHHGVPGPAVGCAAGERLEADGAEFGKRAGELWPGAGCVGRHGAGGGRAAVRRGQHDGALPLQAEQLLAAGHLLRSAGAVAPVQPGTDLLGQAVTRQPRLGLHTLGKPGQCGGIGQALSRQMVDHAAIATSGEALCPEGVVGDDQGQARP